MCEKKRTIMLGLHSPVDRRLLRGWLTSLGYQAVETLDDSADIDLVLLDSASARRLMDRAIRLKREAKYFLPILVCINSGEEVGRWLNAGFDDVLHLPATKAEWRTRIDVMLRLRSQSEMLGKKSERDLLHTLENMSDGFVALDENWHYTYVNKKAGELFDRKPEDLVGKHIWTEFPEGIGQPFYKNYYKAIETQKAIFFEDYYAPWDRWFENRVFPSKNSLCIFFQEITARKQAEQELREREEKFAKAFSTHPDSININRLEDGMYVAVNDGFTRITGYSESDVIGKTSLEINIWANPADREKLVEGLRKHGEVQNFEAPFRMKDGRIVYGLMSAAVIHLGGVPHIISITRDLTAQKETEEALALALREWEGIFQAIGHPTLILSPSHRVQAANRAALKAAGMTAEEVVGKHCYEVFHKASQVQAGCPMETMMRSGRLETVEMEMEAMGGRFLVSCTPVFGEGGELEKVIHIATDVTERVRAEEARRLLQTAIDNAQECIMVSDRENRLTYVNRAFEKFTGYCAAEALGKSPDMLNSGKDDGAVYQRMKNTIYAGEPWKGNLTLKKKNGELYEVYASVTPICDQAGVPEHFVAVHRDVTRERELERRIQQNQRLEAIGTLAGGIAHDFNNLLSPIIGYTELCLDALPDGSEVKADLEEVMRAARRASDLVGQILSFSRRSNQERKPLQMAPIIKEALKLLRASIPVTIQIRRDITDTADLVLADPTEIHQVVMNLCTNAFHAMPEGGILTVGLSPVELEEDAGAVIPNCQPGRYLNLSVEDTGHGIAPEIMEKIFEPYFTTKEEGRGTGLGLAVTHGIVSSCGGAINVYSEPGQGTRFSIYFPVVEEVASKEVAERKTIIARGQESILFVDDDPAIVALAKRLLERHGYSVTTSTNPVRALELFRKAPADFHLVITDMTMPEMTGDLLADALLKIRPDLPIIVCTGFSERMNKEKAQEMGIRCLIEKPLAPGSFLATIREILNQEESPGNA